MTKPAEAKPSRRGARARAPNCFGRFRASPANVASASAHISRGNPLWVPGVPLRERLKLAVWPAITVAVVEDPVAGATVKSVPVPESATVCGLPGALSVIVSVPMREPSAVGVNVTLTAQLAPAATLGPQA